MQDMWQPQRQHDNVLLDSQQHQWGVLVTTLPQRYRTPCNPLHDASRCSSPLGPRYKPTSTAVSIFISKSLILYALAIQLRLHTSLHTLFSFNIFILVLHLHSYSRFHLGSPLFASCQSLTLDSRFRIFQLQLHSFYRPCNPSAIGTLVNLVIKLALGFVMRTSSCAKKRPGKDVDRSLNPPTPQLTRS